MQRQMEEQQKELEEKEFTASVGGGVVKVTVSGKREVTNVELAEEAVDPDDIETLQDLIVAAVNCSYFLAYRLGIHLFLPCLYFSFQL